MKICPRCNAQNSDNNAICTNCGFNFMQSSQSQPLMPQQPIPQQQINLQAAYYQGVKAQQKSAWKTFWLVIGGITAFLVLVFLLAAFSSSPNSSTNPTSADGTEQTTVNSGEVAEETTQKNNAGSYNVEVKSAKLARDVSDDKIVVVTYYFTNNSDEATSFNSVIKDKAFQDGVELGTVWFSHGVDGLDFETARKDIKPGVTFEVTCAYELNNDSSDIEIELYRYYKEKPFYRYTLTLE